MHCEHGRARQNCVHPHHRFRSALFREPCTASPRNAAPSPDVALVCKGFLLCLPTGEHHRATLRASQCFHEADQTVERIFGQVVTYRSRHLCRRRARPSDRILHSGQNVSGARAAESLYCPVLWRRGVVLRQQHFGAIVVENGMPNGTRSLVMTTTAEKTRHRCLVQISRLSLTAEYYQDLAGVVRFLSCLHFF